MYDKIRPTDKFLNPFSWNTILVRDNNYYSVNHYRAQRFPTVQPDRMEIRYQINKQSEADYLRVDITISATK